MIILASNANDFFEIVREAVQWSITVFMQLWSFWYFRLLFIAGLVWIGLDIFAILADSNSYWTDDAGNYHRRF